MTIAILVAMDKEYTLVKEMLKNRQPITYGKRYAEGYMGKVGGNTVILAKCGIGKVNAAMTVTELLSLSTFNIEAVISTGVAGSLDDNIPTGKVIASTACQYWDVWCGKPNEVGQVQGLPVAFVSDADLFQKAYQSDVLLRPGLIVSGDSFIESETEKANIKKNIHNPLAVDMESAALAHVCYLYKVPFLSLRVISDGCDQDDYNKYWDSIAKSSFNAVSKIIEIL